MGEQNKTEARFSEQNREILKGTAAITVLWTKSKKNCVQNKMKIFCSCYCLRYVAYG